LIDIMNEWMGW